ncbi:tetratricopeptide repeat protein, partial [bacterium]|nr:tetratricopeptide repeat protein [bacterium]
KMDDAIQHFRRATDLQPGEPMGYTNLGSALSLKSDFAGAAEAFSRALELEPKSTLALFNLAHSLEVQNRTGEAMDAYERLLRITPGDAEAHLKLGMLLAEQAKKHEALMHLESAYEQARAAKNTALSEEARKQIKKLKSPVE